jgi:predicted Rdx family selenoprotein
LAASLKSRFGEEVTITPGSRGQFDVLLDGRLIFSKAQVSRFPGDGEAEERFAMLKADKELPPIKSEPSVLSRVVSLFRK